MTDYNPIPDNILEPDDPISADLGIRWRDNPIAMFEGAPGAPNLQFAALGTLVAGSTSRFRVSVVQSTTLADAVAMLFGLGQPGTIRLYCQHRHNGGSTASVSISFRRWRLNAWTNLVTYTIGFGTGWTARALDISVLPGDTIGVFSSGGGGGAISEVQSITIATDGGLLWPFPTLTPLE